MYKFRKAIWHSIDLDKIDNSTRRSKEEAIKTELKTDYNAPHSHGISCSCCRKLVNESTTHHTTEENSRRVKLIVVDSPVALYRSEYVGRKMLSERQQKLYKFMMSLMQLSLKYNLAVVVTNHATTVPDSTMDKDESCKPYGGNVMGHATSYGIHLSRFETETGIFRAQLLKSSYHPWGEVTFMIKRHGILG